MDDDNDDDDVDHHHHHHHHQSGSESERLASDSDLEILTELPEPPHKHSRIKNEPVATPEAEAGELNKSSSHQSSLTLSQLGRLPPAAVAEPAPKRRRRDNSNFKYKPVKTLKDARKVIRNIFHKVPWS